MLNDEHRIPYDIDDPYGMRSLGSMLACDLCPVEDTQGHRVMYFCIVDENCRLMEILDIKLLEALDDTLLKDMVVANMISLNLGAC